ncbi:uncharacterized protein LOC125771633 [Anopheles funestus]|uniref:uncharacterized protein LOC125771633 n=1 Tax=Anopheles funestus TaxID=62324 RepID=UPI0020C5BC53|nr:uncharacterized protein LOC125771633 [Anopheles funestus]
MASHNDGTSRKTAKLHETEDTTPSFSIENLLQLKQSKPSQNRDIDVISSMTTNRKTSTLSDNSSYLESDDSCDSGRLQIAWSGTNSTSNDAQSMMFYSNSLRSHPLKRYNALISMTDAKIPIVYHKSMARQFPTIERTPEQMEMRRRNTEAARVSRSKMKMAELLMQQEANELSTANTTHKQMIASQLVYANTLSKLLDMQPVELKFVERVGRRNSINV